VARGLWAAFSIVVGVVAFAVVAGSGAALTRLLALLSGVAPGSLQLGAYGALALAAAVFALVIFLFLILVPELTDIARLDGVLRALRAVRPLHEASPVKLLRALAGSPLLTATAAALQPSLRLEDHPQLSEKLLVSDVAPAALIAPPASPPRARFLRAVLAMLVLCGATLALLNTALPQTLIAHADGVTAAAIGTVALAVLPLGGAIVLWASHEILRDITRLQLRLVQDELRALISPAQPAALAALAGFDGEALRAALRADMETLQHSLKHFMDAALRRLEAAPAQATIDISAQLGELPQIAGALGALREELTATVQVARDATKLLFSSAQHIEDIANLMREGGARPPAANESGLAPAPAPSVAPNADPDDPTNDLRRAIGELLAETSAQSARLPKF
jgi:hypothetical protein